MNFNRIYLYTLERKGRTWYHPKLSISEVLTLTLNATEGAPVGLYLPKHGGTEVTSGDTSFYTINKWQPWCPEGLLFSLASDEMGKSQDS